VQFNASRVDIKFEKLQLLLVMDGGGDGDDVMMSEM